jgi:hypothetical protein
MAYHFYSGAAPVTLTGQPSFTNSHQHSSTYARNQTSTPPFGPAHSGPQFGAFMALSPTQAAHTSDPHYTGLLPDQTQSDEPFDKEVYQLLKEFNGKTDSQASLVDAKHNHMSCAPHSAVSQDHQPNQVERTNAPMMHHNGATFGPNNGNPNVFEQAHDHTSTDYNSMSNTLNFPLCRLHWIAYPCRSW